MMITTIWGACWRKNCAGTVTRSFLVTPAADVSHWTHNTLEQFRIQARLLEMGVEIVALHNLAAVGSGVAELSCVLHGQATKSRLRHGCTRNLTLAEGRALQRIV